MDYHFDGIKRIKGTIERKVLGDKAHRRFKRFYEEEGEFEILTLASWFSHYSYSRTSIRSSMRGWLGKYSMLSKVLRSKKKKKKERKKKIEKWKKKEKNKMLLSSFCLH